MRKFLMLASVLVGLVACAAQYGNFIQHAEPKNGAANEKKMANDVVKKLSALYPPARTRFDLLQDTSDYFGTCLVQSMRAKGYAVLEHKAASKPASPGLSLSYIVDQVKDSGLYRVTVTINRQQSLDRAYQVAQDGLVYPAGSWTRKE
jgi:type IV secretion system protein TrbH